MPSMRGIGPLSYQGVGRLFSSITLQELPPLRLKIVTLPPSTDGNSSGVALVNPESCQEWKKVLSSACHVTLTNGSDCMLLLRAEPSIEVGCIALDEVQQHNLHTLHGEIFSFSIFSPPDDAPLELTDVDADVRLLQQVPIFPATVNADQLCRLLGKQLFGKVLAVNEMVVTSFNGVQVLSRITATDTLDPDARAEAVGYHCYRGLVTPETQFYLTAMRQGHQTSNGGVASTSSRGTSAENEAAALPFTLIYARPRPAIDSGKHTVTIETSDGEVFPVKRKLLRSCIALTSALRSTSETSTTIRVPVDTLTFDRVLIFLEALSLSKPAPKFAARLLDELLAAGKALGLRSLEEHCKGKLGEFDSRLRVYTFDQVKEENASGSCWLILDGMLLDVTRWLPEHPGGSKIIPAQALNLESSRFFEVFHASRESFLYLKEFYIGELEPSDRALVPCEVPPSEDFLQQLREYTSFRMPISQKVFKSF